MRIAVVGATGLVGREMLAVLEEDQFPVSELIPVASARSVGMEVMFQGKPWKVVGMDEAIAMKPDIALFSAGGSTSLEHAPRFAAAGIRVVDNSSAWRMDPTVPLVVPEINASAIGDSMIIANPNCSTIQMVMVLWPLQQHFGIRRTVVSTYQSVSGTGKHAVEQMENERAGKLDGPRAYFHPIDKNCIPHCDVFLENGYTKEEMKMVNESRKIMGLPNFRLTATAVRVPVSGGHSEAVNLELERPFTLEKVREILSATPGVVVMDDPSQNVYPMPLLARGKNDVFVGRLRRDESLENGLNLWIVSDNLRKGAATNAVQIARCLI
jgi:aspartate-semialdehyde dehydrogenase